MNAPEESICSTAAGKPSAKSWRAEEMCGRQPQDPRSEIAFLPRAIATSI